MTELESSSLFSQLDGTGRWVYGEVSGSTSALFHTGESFYWRLSLNISPVYPLHMVCFFNFCGREQACCGSTLAFKEVISSFCSNTLCSVLSHTGEFDGYM